MSKDRPWGKGTPKVEIGDDSDDSNQTFTVPTGKIRDWKSLYVKLNTTATVGSRLLYVKFTDGTNTLYTVALPVLAASNSQEIQISFTGETDDYTVTGVAGTSYSRGIAPLIATAGYTVQIYDANAVDAAADDLTIRMHYVEYDA